MLTLDQVKALKQLAPAEEDIELVSDFAAQPGNSITSLGPAEQYIHHIMGIPRLAKRLECWIFKRRFEADISEVLPDLQTLVRSAEEISTSTKFKDLLKTVLAIGNYMNAGGFRGEAYGFQIDALVKLRDTRSNVSSSNQEKMMGVTTLFHFLVYHSDRKSGAGNGFVDFGEDMPHLEPVSRISNQALQSQVKSLAAGVSLVISEIKALSEADSLAGDNFVSIMAVRF